MIRVTGRTMIHDFKARIIEVDGRPHRGSLCSQGWGRRRPDGSRSARRDAGCDVAGEDGSTWGRSDNPDWDYSAEGAAPDAKS
jgi:hypothetical protein